MSVDDSVLADEDRLLEAEDLARMFGMTTDWIYGEVRRGRLPHIRMGRYVRFRRSTILQWLADQESGSTISQTRKVAGRR